MNLDWRYSEGGYEIDVAKNRTVKQFLDMDVPQGKEHLLMIANDMVPMPTTVRMVTDPGDLIFCQSMGNEGRLNHVGDKNFSAACWRGHAKVLQSFGPPWFRMGHTGDILDQTYCDCSFFKDRAQEQGFDARQVGIIGHEQRCILVPDQSAPTEKWVMFWPSQWPAQETLHPGLPMAAPGHTCPPNKCPPQKKTVGKL